MAVYGFCAFALAEWCCVCKLHPVVAAQVHWCMFCCSCTVSVCERLSAEKARHSAPCKRCVRSVACVIMYVILQVTVLTMSSSCCHPRVLRTICRTCHQQTEVRGAWQLPSREAAAAAGRVYNALTGCALVLVCVHVPGF